MAYMAKRGDIIWLSITPQSGHEQAGDQAKILDVASRNAEFIETAPDDIVFEALDIVTGILD